MKKKTPRKKLDEKCLILWSKIIRLPQTCAICCKTQSESNPVIFHGHHLISRRYAAGRWSLENGVCLCQSCHFIEKPDPEKFRDNILRAIGENKFNELKSKFMQTKKVTESDLSVIYAGLKLEYEKRLMIEKLIKNKWIPTGFNGITRAEAYRHKRDLYNLLRPEHKSRVKKYIRSGK
jgi:hypothetical protein